MKNDFCPATALHGGVALPFVIPSEAEGSAVLRTIPGNVFRQRIMALRATQGDENGLKGTAFRPSITITITVALAAEGRHFRQSEA